jgi:protein TonB
MNQQSAVFEGFLGAAPWAAWKRAAMLTAAAVTLTVSGPTAFAADAVQFGPTVTVTASRDATTSSETAYVEAAYKKLQSASRYPSGRDASLERPSGTTTVWANVARDGRVKARGVEQSSGSAMLDDMAKALIGRSRFPAFAAGDFAGGPTQRFVVSYRFDGVAMTAGKGSKVAAR